MRSKNGAWGAFDKDNTRQLVYRLPFADFGAMLDLPSEDVTAHVLELLAGLGYSFRDRVVAEGIDYLQHNQRSDGSWFGRWGVNHIYGSWSAIQALASFPERTGAVQTMIDRAAAWIIGRQNSDGGWGETCHSYEDASFAGVGVSTPSQTAWAVLALQSAGLGSQTAAQRGVDFLRRTQLDGTWAEPQYTGTGFPRDFYINYHLYRHIFPTMALGGASAL
jgi:squalene-hopene/tetraprenyl-beta-curcumene cyclase